VSCFAQMSDAGGARGEGQPQGGHGPFLRQVRWAAWWVTVFVGVTTGLLVWMALRATFLWWALSAAFVWLPMELFGAFRSPVDAYPPLTQITREYVPRWVTFALIYGAVGLGGGTWFGFRHRWWLAALGILLGWLTTHFDVTYDAPAVKQENAKYKWYADKLGLKRVSAKLAANQRKRESGYLHS